MERRRGAVARGCSARSPARTAAGGFRAPPAGLFPTSFSGSQSPVFLQKGPVGPPAAAVPGRSRCLEAPVGNRLSPDFKGLLVVPSYTVNSGK